MTLCAIAGKSAILGVPAIRKPKSYHDASDFVLHLNVSLDIYGLFDGTATVALDRDVFESRSHECPGSFQSPSVHMKKALELQNQAILNRKAQLVKHTNPIPGEALGQDSTNKMRRQQRWRYLLDRKCSLPCPVVSSRLSSVCTDKSSHELWLIALS